ncbi:MAG: enoyl-CoA hydratase/isomerase family protein [Candidatus Methanofastidiosia archaeon]
MYPETKFKTIALRHEDEIAHVALNRSKVQNAFNDVLIRELTECFTQLTEEDNIKIIVLTGEGQTFCSGADLNWMKKMAHYTRGENLSDSKKLAEMYYTIDRCPKPVVGRINGSAFGGGVGLVAVCDIAIASIEAQFAFSEVKLGIVPAVISTYLIPKIGPSNARALFLTGERFGAERALRIGLVHEICPPEELDSKIDEKLKILKSSAPKASIKIKQLIRNWFYMEFEEFRNHTIELIADLRASREGKEGISAFLERRKPVWR